MEEEERRAGQLALDNQSAEQDRTVVLTELDRLRGLARDVAVRLPPGYIILILILNIILITMV